jgi:peptide/nickel transport system substrate-binding protein
LRHNLHTAHPIPKAIALLVAIGGLLLAALGATVGAAAKTPDVSAKHASSDDLIIDVGNSIGPESDSFNPLEPTSGLNGMGIATVIYEPLVEFDLIKPGTTYPWLATSWHWSDGGKALTLDLRHGVRWSDGTSFTSADVVYTFELIKRYPALNINGIAFSTVRAAGPYQVAFKFAQPEFSYFYYIASQVIVPAHIWSNVKDPVTWPDLQPVGTGPYLLRSYSLSGSSFVRNPDYWQKGLPKLYGFDYVTVDSAATQNIDTNLGQQAWNGATEPNIQKLFVARDPKDNHYWYPPVFPNGIVPNVTVWPLDNLAVRKAMSLVINRQEVYTRGNYGFEPIVDTLTGLTPDQYGEYLAPQYKGAKPSLLPQVSEARALLKSAGFKFNSKGLLLNKQGQPLTLSITVPSCCVNDISTGQILVPEFASIGITLDVDVPSVAVFDADLASGHFDMAMGEDFLGYGPSPFIFYNKLLNYSLSAPIGSNATGDYSRWHDSATQRYITDYEDATTTAQEVQAIHGLESIMVDDLPMIPLTYQVSWSNYRTNQVVGWPTPQDPYSSPAIYEPDNELVFLHLRPVG